MKADGSCIETYGSPAPVEHSIVVEITLTLTHVLVLSLVMSCRRFPGQYRMKSSQELSGSTLDFCYFGGTALEICVEIYIRMKK